MNACLCTLPASACATCPNSDDARNWSLSGTYPLTMPEVVLPRRVLTSPNVEPGHALLVKVEHDVLDAVLDDLRASLVRTVERSLLGYSWIDGVRNTGGTIEVHRHGYTYWEPVDEGAAAPVTIRNLGKRARLDVLHAARTLRGRCAHAWAALRGAYDDEEGA